VPSAPEKGIVVPRQADPIFDVLRASLMIVPPPRRLKGVPGPGLGPGDDARDCMQHTASGVGCKGNLAAGRGAGL
jgi:hypothetical protein